MARIAVPDNAPPAKPRTRKDPKVTPVLPTGRSEYLATSHLVVKSGPTRTYVHAGHVLPANAEPSDVERLVSLGMVHVKEISYEGVTKP
ncbi:hypothetical protein AHiyo4_07690 [Arthrobacter sp. Hiyo4]|nr:hypothetical protein AHiyo4_07690 [Arthrobacter sp. Hiyo4]